MVSKAALKGMSESIVQFTPMILEHCNKLNGGPEQGNVSGAGDQVAVDATQTNPASTNHLTNSTITNKEAEKSNGGGWYSSIVGVWEMVQDILPIPVFSVLIGILVLWTLWIWLRSSSSKQHGLYSSSSPQHQIVSRAVYLRDVEEGLLNATQQVSYMDHHW